MPRSGRPRLPEEQKRSNINFFVANKAEQENLNRLSDMYNISRAAAARYAIALAYELADGGSSSVRPEMFT